MPGGNSGGTYCAAGVWTTVYQGSTWGFTYLWSRSGSIRVQWRRYASGAPWYNSGSVSLSSSKKTLWHGGPAGYLRLKIKPSSNVTIQAS